MRTNLNKIENQKFSKEKIAEQKKFKKVDVE